MGGVLNNTSVVTRQLKRFALQSAGAWRGKTIRALIAFYELRSDLKERSFNLSRVCRKRARPPNTTGEFHYQTPQVLPDHT